MLSKLHRKNLQFEIVALVQPTGFACRQTKETMPFTVPYSTARLRASDFTRSVSQHETDPRSRRNTRNEKGDSE